MTSGSLTDESLPIQIPVREQTTPRIENQPSLLDQNYEDLKSDEAIKPNPNDIFKFSIVEGTPEHGILKSSSTAVDGIEQALTSGKYTRRQLLEAGFVLINKIGGKEKAIISGDFPDPEDPTKILNFGQRTLLTKTELQKVYTYQKLHPEVFGLQGEDLDEVRKDMLSCLMYGASDLEDPYPTNWSFFGSLTYLTDSDSLSPDYNLRIASYWKAQYEQFRRANNLGPSGEAYLQFGEMFTREHLSDLYKWKTADEETAASGVLNHKRFRGHDTTTLTWVRRKKLEGVASPFLESGFRFGSNPDIDVYGVSQDGIETRMRINIASLHLMGAHPDYPGFSEMGGSSDQIYMPIGTYIHELYPKDPSERETMHKTEEQELLDVVSRSEMEDKISQRLLQLASEWQEQHAQSSALSKIRAAFTAITRR